MSIVMLILFLLLMVFIELYIFRVLFSFFFKDTSDNNYESSKTLKVYFQNKKSFTFTLFYWFVILALPLNMFLHFKGIINPYDFKPWIYVNAIFFILLITRLSVGLFSAITDLMSWVADWFTVKQSSDDFNSDRKVFLKNMAVVIGLIPFPTFLYGMIRNPYRYKVRKHTVLIPDLKADLEGLRLVQISDIHAGSWVFKSPVETAVKLINELDADLVFFTGDLVNYRASEMEPFVELFSKIKSRLGVYSVLGNHDYGDYYRWNSESEKKENFQQLLEIKKQMGWKLLRNENEIVKIGDSELAIIGVENYSALPQFPRYGDLSLAYKGSENADLRILLSHDPTHWDAEVRKNFNDIELTLSGHTHGFQFGLEIPGIVRWSPSSLIYRQWGGLYVEKNNYLYVNRGLGYLGYPGRVGILPEITFIEIKNKPDVYV
jgi:predicted MPP superfamily phosphohydrolase